MPQGIYPLATNCENLSHRKPIIMQYTSKTSYFTIFTVDYNMKFKQWLINTNESTSHI